MSTKELTAGLLQEAAARETGDTYLSGATLAASLGVSRTAVWKAVQTLQKEGYAIEAVPGKGYRLAEEHDILSASGAAGYLKDGALADLLEVHEEVTSTNDLVHGGARAGKPQGFVVAARRQSRGRGRKGRAFFSPEDTGLYFSILLRPAGSFDPGEITITAAVAVAKALERLEIPDVGIKWVNDVYVGERKVCGILTEGVQNLETSTLDHAVLGIGVNVYEPKEGFPVEISQRAGSILGRERRRDMRNRLLAYIYEAFFELYGKVPFPEVVEVYRRFCFVPGRTVTVIRGDEERKALALSLDETCGLTVRYEDGTRETLRSGEISLRM